MNQLVFGFVLPVIIMLVGLDCLLRMQPRMRAGYHRLLRRVGGHFLRQVTRFARWAWREYHQFILGAVTMLALLYYMGRLH